MVQDRTRARHRLSKFLLRHGRVWRGGVAWTQGFDRWLASQRFAEPALTTTFRHYRAVLEVRDAQLDAIEAELAVWYGRAPFADAVQRLAAYRGVTRLGGLTLASEVCDWRRFARASGFMGCCGLVPSEHSSGQVTRRGHITKAGNTHLRAQLVESAWAYQHRPGVGATITRRQEVWTPRSWPGLGRAAAVVRPLPAPWRPQDRQERGRHRDRPGARRVPVGRDDRRLTTQPSPASLIGRGGEHRHDAPGRRRCRTDPRRFYALQPSWRRP